MRTAHSVTPSLTGSDVLISLLGYMAVYCIMFPAGLWMVMRIVRGPGLPRTVMDRSKAGRPGAGARRADQPRGAG